MSITVLLLISVFDIIAAQEICEADLFPNDHQFVGVLGKTYIYSCQGWNDEDSVNVAWYLNQTDFSNVNIDGIYLIPPTNGISSKLVIEMSSREHNNTEIFCTVEYSGETSCNSSKSVFILQGVPPIVSDVEINFNISCTNTGTVTIDWNPGFSLPYSRDPNNYRYMIQVQDSLSHYINTTTSANTVMTFLPDYTIANASCVLFNITVLPTNTAGSGTPFTMQESVVDLENITTIVMNGTYIDDNHYLYRLHLIPAVCDIQVVQLTNLFDEADTFFIPEGNVNVSSNCNENSIIMLDINSNIYRNRRYKTILTVEGKTAKDNISSHDIQNILVNENQRQLSVNYLTNAIAKGVLLFFRSPDIDNYFLYIDKENSQNYTFPPSRNYCTMTSFDTERNGYLRNGTNYPATNPMNVTHIKPFRVPDFNISKCLQYNNNQVAVKSSCICLEMVIEEMYQFIIVNSSDESGKIIVMNSDCFKEFSVDLTYNVTYYLSIYANIGDEALAIIPTISKHLTKNKAAIITSNVFTMIGSMTVLSHLLF